MHFKVHYAECSEEMKVSSAIENLCHLPSSSHSQRCYTQWHLICRLGIPLVNGSIWTNQFLISGVRSRQAFHLDISSDQRSGRDQYRNAHCNGECDPSAIPSSRIDRIDNAEKIAVMFHDIEVSYCLSEYR